MRRWSCLGPLLVVLLLSACATTPYTTAPSPGWLREQARAAALDRWILRGRLALTVENQAWHANLFWQQAPGSYTLRLSTPLGQGAALIEGGPAEVRIELPDGTRDAAPDAETLVTRHLGWRLPLEGLHWWVRGIPAPDSDYRPAFDAEGHLARLEQAGWRIDFRDFTEVNGLRLPSRLFLHHDHLDLRLAVSQWQLPAGN